MIDVFVRMAPTAVSAGVVAESVRWAAGADPSAAKHQVVTLFGDPSVTHLAWAVAAANQGLPDAVWQIGADGSAMAADLTVATAVLRDDAAVLLSNNGAQLRTAIAHLSSVKGQEEHSAGIRVPLMIGEGVELDDDAMLASLREAEGDLDAEPMEDDIAA
jgi:hypothetical protein